MYDYLERGRQGLAAGNRTLLGNLVNDTLGKHLPHLFKRFNFRHISNLADHEYAQMHFHIEQLLSAGGLNTLGDAYGIAIPVLFINGAWDEYTSAMDVQSFKQYIRDCSFSIAQSSGHFLDLESKAAANGVHRALLGHLLTHRDARPEAFCMSPPHRAQLSFA